MVEQKWMGLLYYAIYKFDMELLAKDWITMNSTVDTIKILNDVVKVYEVSIMETGNCDQKDVRMSL